MKCLPYISFFCLIGCDNTQQEGNHTETHISGIQMFAKSFVEANSNFNQNNVISKRVFDNLSKEFYLQLNTGILNDHPLEFREITSYDGKSYAHFMGTPSYGDNSEIGIGMDVVGIVGPMAADTLITGDYYTIQGDDYENISDSYGDYGSMFFTNEYKIRKEYSKTEVMLGVTKMKITGLKKVNQ